MTRLFFEFFPIFKLELIYILGSDNSHVWMNDGRLNTADYDDPNNLTNRQNQAEPILQVNNGNAGIKVTEYKEKKLCMVRIQKK